MESKDHIKAAEQWEEVAEKNAEKEYVIPQAYFYSTINYIEAILAKQNRHPRSHEDRESYMRDVYGFNRLDQEMHEQLTSGRREAGYRGRDGHKLKRIKKAYKHFKEKWEKL